MNISFIIAFWGGILSFFSPCILPLIPVYLSYITGVSMYDINNTNKRFTLLSKILVFVIGFSLVFSLLGASVSFIGNWLFMYKYTLNKIGGVILIIFGLSFTGLLKIPFLYKEVKPNIKITGGYLGAFIFGLIFALGWTPCVTPILSSILMYAVGENSAYRGFLLLLFYALGIGVPFILIGIFIDSYLKNMSKFKKILPYMSYIGGIFLILIGIYMVLGKTLSQIFS